MTKTAKPTSGRKRAELPPESPLLARKVALLQRQLKRAKAKIASLEARADTDPLTDIANRRGFERDLGRAIAYAIRYRVSAALIFLDIDRLKPVNDTFGHAAGDALLKAVAVALTGCVRASDIVARIGGDEFVVLMWNLGEDDAEKRVLVLERIIGEIILNFDGQTVKVSASAGFAMLGADDTPASVLARADQAMYARKLTRKSSGRSRIAGITRTQKKLSNIKQ
jgi:diguanylate cyclase (GGDEF)-like protein